MCLAFSAIRTYFDVKHCRMFEGALYNCHFGMVQKSVETCCTIIQNFEVMVHQRLTLQIHAIATTIEIQFRQRQQDYPPFV